MSDRKDVITAIEDFNYRENLEKIENINLLGRNIIYVEAITEFLEQYPKIKIILISEKFFYENKIEIEKVADKYQEIAFYILYDKKINVESEIKENMCFYEKNEFLYNYGQQKEKEKEYMENAIELNLKPSNYLVFECDYINSTSLYEFCKKIYRTIIPNIECELEDLPDIEEYLPNNKLKLYIPIK